jgi:hypothetical protein
LGVISISFCVGSGAVGLQCLGLLFEDEGKVVAELGEGELVGLRDRLPHQPSPALDDPRDPRPDGPGELGVGTADQYFRAGGAPSLDSRESLGFRAVAGALRRGAARVPADRRTNANCRPEGVEIKERVSARPMNE